MIFGLGTDITEVNRIEKQVSKGREFLEGIFTSREIAYCDSKARKAEYFSGRFAAKEAFLKALGTGWRDGISFSDIEILNDKLGKPYFRLHGKAKDIIDELNIKQINVSISHVKELAISVVIIEK